MASIDLRGHGSGTAATTSPHFSVNAGFVRILGVLCLAFGLGVVIILALFGALTNTYTLLFGGAATAGACLLVLDYSGHRRGAALLAIYGLSLCVVAARLAAHLSIDFWHVSLLVVPIIMLTVILGSTVDLARIGLLHVSALWLDAALRNEGLSDIARPMLSDIVVLTLIYPACALIGAAGRNAFDQVLAQVDISKRTIASRNTLLERQIREREHIERRQAELAKDMRVVMSATQELLGCESVAEVWRKAVEIAQSRLGVERSAVLLLDADGERATGAFGVDMSGTIRDISTRSLTVTGQRWASLFHAPNPDNPAWMLDDPSLPDIVDGQTGHRAWVAVTAIRARSGAWLGVFYNDTAISGRPFSPVKQDMLALYMSLVAGIVRQKQLEGESRLLASESATLAERSRLARELHDSVSQALFGIVLGSRTAAELNGSAEAGKALEYVLTLAESALVDIRALIFELRPESLAQDGLMPSLQKQLESIMQRHNIGLVIDAPIEPPLSIQSREAVYRVIIEAAQNIAKHAQATEVRLSCSHDPKRGIVRAEIADNGRGFNPEQSFDGHYGLVNMRERMLRLNGTCKIESATGKGTRVIITLPAETISAPLAV
jgi:signal transduction histidine kinase